MTTGPRRPLSEEVPDNYDRGTGPATDQRSEFIPEHPGNISIEDNQAKSRGLGDDTSGLEDNEGDITLRETDSPDDRFREERIDNSEY